MEMPDTPMQRSKQPLRSFPPFFGDGGVAQEAYSPDERPLTLRQIPTAVFGQLYRSNRKGMTDGSQPIPVAASAFAPATLSDGGGLLASMQRQLLTVRSG